MTGGAPRLRRNFAWALVGTATYNLMQWVLVVILARLGTSSMVGVFALGQAIAAPVFLTVGLNLRAVRATDVRGTWSPEQYARLRQVLNLVSIMLTMAAAVVFGLRGAALATVLALSLSKSAEATSQTLYGFFQRREHLDLVSRSMLLRAVLGPAGFVLGLVASGQLVVACLGLALGWVVTYLLHDRPAEQRLLRDEPAPAPTAGLRDLARKAFPLGLDGGVISVTNNVPRYTVHAVFGTAALGSYATLAYLGQVVAMVTGSLADSLIGRLATQAEAGNRRGFVRSMRQLLAFAVATGLVATALAALVGDPVIRLVLGEEYVNQPVLVLLLAGAGLVTVQRCLGRGLQATHRYRDVLLVDCVTLVAALVAALVLVPAFGLPGAAATLGCGFGVGAVAGAIRLRTAAGRIGAPAVGA